MTPHPTATREQWLQARRELLAREKELTHRSDELARERQALPWVPITKDYTFASEDGPQTLADLFGGRGQLIVYHFMFHPDWDEGCKSCSSILDHLDRPRRHLEHHDVAVVAVSRAPLDKLLAYRERMGWTLPWVSSHDTDFNYDFWVSSTEERPLESYNFTPLDGYAGSGELPGMSAFAMQDGVVHHTYSAHARGMDVLWGMFQWLDRAPKGRNEDSVWWRRHDEYPVR